MDRVRGRSRIFIGEGLQVLGAPSGLLKGRLYHERCQCTTTKIMYLGIIIATPLRPVLQHTLRFTPDAWCLSLADIGPFRPTQATLRWTYSCELTSLEDFKGDRGLLEADGGYLTRAEGSVNNSISSYIKIKVKCLWTDGTYLDERILDEWKLKVASCRPSGSGAL